MRVVTIGGGTGQYHVLRALMLLRESLGLSITAIPTTSDSGSSSGILRLQHDVVAPGDISQCVFGLHPEPEKIAWFMGHRFRGNGQLRGHTLRNAMVVAAFEEYSVGQKAMEAIAETFDLCGRIAPITFDRTHLYARLLDGVLLEGEDAISQADLLSHGGVEKLWLKPSAKPNREALQAIRSADVIIVCPGTSACSIIPNFLVDGVVEGLRDSKAIKIHVVNLMNRLGHTPPEWSVRDYVREIEAYLGAPFFDLAICNSEELSVEQREAYKEEKSLLMRGAPKLAGEKCIYAWYPLLAPAPPPQETDAIAHLRASVRHDPHKLARALERVLGKASTQPVLAFDLDRTLLRTDDLRAALDAARLRRLRLGSEEFREGEISEFLYSDTLPTLDWARRQGIRMALLTHTDGWPLFQASKVKGAGIEGFFDEFVYVEEDSKGEALARRMGKGVSGVAVDDARHHSKSLQSHCPRIKFVPIDREGEGGDGAIRSLEEVRRFFL